MTLPPIRMRPKTCGMTAPSVDEVMRRLSSRWLSIRWVGASDDTMKLSTTEPTADPTKPPMVAALTPRMLPPMLPPMAEPAKPRAREAMWDQVLLGKRKAKAMRRRQACVSGSSITPSRS
jgi:hypothetical protein